MTCFSLWHKVHSIPDGCRQRSVRPEQRIQWLTEICTKLAIMHSKNGHVSSHRCNYGLNIVCQWEAADGPHANRERRRLSIQKSALASVPNDWLLYVSLYIFKCALLFDIQPHIYIKIRLESQFSTEIYIMTPNYCTSYRMTWIIERHAICIQLVILLC